MNEPYHIPPNSPYDVEAMERLRQEKGWPSAEQITRANQAQKDKDVREWAEFRSCLGSVILLAEVTILWLLLRR